MAFLTQDQLAHVAGLISGSLQESKQDTAQRISALAKTVSEHSDGLHRHFLHHSPLVSDTMSRKNLSALPDAIEQLHSTIKGMQLLLTQLQEQSKQNCCQPVYDSSQWHSGATVAAITTKLDELQNLLRPWQDPIVIRGGLANILKTRAVFSAEAAGYSPTVDGDWDPAAIFDEESDIDSLQQGVSSSGLNKTGKGSKSKKKR